MKMIRLSQKNFSQEAQASQSRKLLLSTTRSVIWTYSSTITPRFAIFYQVCLTKLLNILSSKVRSNMQINKARLSLSSKLATIFTKFLVWRLLRSLKNGLKKRKLRLRNQQHQSKKVNNQKKVKRQSLKNLQQSKILKSNRERSQPNLLFHMISKPII